MMNGKDVEGSGLELILRSYPSICLEALRKTTKNLSGQPVFRLRFEPETF
jgi:hypothetical protein